MAGAFLGQRGGAIAHRANQSRVVSRYLDRQYSSQASSTFARVSILLLLHFSECKQRNSDFEQLNFFLCAGVLRECVSKRHVSLRCSLHVNAPSPWGASSSGRGESFRPFLSSAGSGSAPIAICSATLNQRGPTAVCGVPTIARWFIGLGSCSILDDSSQCSEYFGSARMALLHLVIETGTPRPCRSRG